MCIYNIGTCNHTLMVYAVNSVSGENTVYGVHITIKNMCVVNGTDLCNRISLYNVGAYKINPDRYMYIYIVCILML